MLIKQVTRIDPFIIDDRKKVKYTLEDLQQISFYIIVTKNRYKFIKTNPWIINGKKMFWQKARIELQLIHKKIRKELRIDF